MKTDIDFLLEQYWNGESSLEEEKRLREYFSGNDIDHKHLPYQQLFQYFEFAQNINYNINSVDLKKLIFSKRHPIINLRRIASIAAIFLLFTSAFWFFDQSNSAKNSLSEAYQIEDAEEATQITLEALAMISLKLDKSATQIKTDLKSLNTNNIFK